VRQGGIIDPADGLGTWNTDIEKVSPSCSIVEFVNIPLDCYNPPPVTSPEPGLTVSLSQTSSGGAVWTSNGTVRSSAAFIAQYNLPFNAPLQLAVTFPPGAPAYCASNLTLSATPGPYSVTGKAIQYNAGAPASAPGFPKDSAGNPIDFADVVNGDHSCSSHIYIETHP